MSKHFMPWLVRLPFAVALVLFCWALAPFVALFVVQELKTDRVKRFSGIKFSLMRTNLIKPFRWFQTHDNNCDEWWYGAYNKNHFFKFARIWIQHDYDNSAFVRWYCRVCWLIRNPAYGFHYALLSKPREDDKGWVIDSTEGKKWQRMTLRPSSFQYQAHMPLGKYLYIDINIGYKKHKLMPKLMYANRFFSIKTY